MNKIKIIIIALFIVLIGVVYAYGQKERQTSSHKPRQITSTEAKGGCCQQHKGSGRELSSEPADACPVEHKNMGSKGCCSNTSDSCCMTQKGTRDSVQANPSSAPKGAGCCGSHPCKDCYQKEETAEPQETAYVIIATKFNGVTKTNRSNVKTHARGCCANGCCSCCKAKDARG